ncbi:MAG: discoidin domain-containing protein [Planctomycetota bacterium]
MLQKKLVRSLLYLVVALGLSTTSVMGADVLFIAADPTEATFTADGLIKNVLEGLGHTVTYFDDNEMEANMEAAAAAADLVYISESVGSGNVHSKITEIETPMIVGEPYAWDEMGMTLGGGGTSDVASLDIRIVDPGHYLAAGLSGTVTVLTDTAGPEGTAQFANGQVGGDGTAIATATLADGQTYDIIVVYDKGDRLAVAPADGSPQVAADIRVGMFFHYYAQPVLNPNGWALVRAAVNYALGLMEPPGSAKKPHPADGATDVPRDVVLGWEPGDFAPAVNAHRVFLGEVFSDVNEGTVGIAQDANSYAPPQRLDFETTYYWRVDEVNAPPDSTVYKGKTWSFTTEPVGHPISGASITATASSMGQENFGPENTIDGSGLDPNGLHSTEATDMWLSGSEPLGAWIQYELDKVYKLHEMWVWNSNQIFEALFGFGMRDVTVEYSADGAEWTALADVPEFAQAPGTGDYAHNITVDFGGALAKVVRLTATSNWAGVLPQYGLSEVRLFSIPVSARKPSPDSGTTDVGLDATLSWRAGREAGTHDVYLSTDEQAVIDGTAPVVTVTDASYSSALDLGSTYYWRIDEVNEAETPTTWQGDVWDFTTQEFIVVEDFEDYNDWPPHEIYTAWPDGYEDPANGSQVGNLLPPLAETTIVHGDAQSMPHVFRGRTHLCRSAGLDKVRR